MANIITIKATDGSTVKYVDKIIAQGGMKDVYFSPDKSYVVAFFRKKPDFAARERLEMITGLYNERIFNNVGGDYWKKLYCWPTKIVERGGKLGIVAPTYESYFFFQYGSKNNDFLNIRGKEKEGKWFASASNQSKFLDPRERGNWLSYFRICILISRAVRRMHAAGLAHSDLSYKNVLVDPAGGNACIIDIDGLVVPGKYPPDVVGTPDFIAPEVIATSRLPFKNKAGQLNSNRKLPSIATDKHALAVLIYMYLLYRHPLRGGKVHDSDPQEDEFLSMGEKALFIEHSLDKSNRPNLKHVRSSYLPWADVGKIPYSVCGPYLRDLFDLAFMDGLHKPHIRPSAMQWEDALVKTIDLMQPCSNKSCDQGWFVFDNTTKPTCPFCKTTYNGALPVLNLYSNRGGNKFRPDNHRLMVYHNQYLYMWHVNRRITPNEKCRPEDKRPVGYFVLHNGKWVFVNQRLQSMRDMTDKKDIPPNSMVELTDGKQLLLSKEEGGRLVLVQMVNK